MKMARDGESGTWKIHSKVMIIWQVGFYFTYILIVSMFFKEYHLVIHRALCNDTISRQRFQLHYITVQREIQIRKACCAISVADCCHSESNDWNVGIAQRKIPGIVSL